MEFKQKLQEDFVKAMKEKNEIAKMAISSLKSQILIAEKSLGSKGVNQETFWTIVSKMITQRKESAQIFLDAKREDLYKNEMNQIEFLSLYLPEQMSGEEVKEELQKILQNMISSNLPPAAKRGKALGEFNRNFRGRCDLELVSSILNEIID